MAYYLLVLAISKIYLVIVAKNEVKVVATATLRAGGRRRAITNLQYTIIISGVHIDTVIYKSAYMLWSVFFNNSYDV